MTTRHKAKISKLRGKRSHARGKAKRGRGRGSRMGRASVKRSQRNIQHIIKYEPERFHQKGFHSLSKKLKTINVTDLEKISEKQNKTSFALKNIKVLGKGKITKKLKVTASAFTKKAMEKITKAGGQAIVAKGENIGLESTETNN